MSEGLPSLLPVCFPLASTFYGKAKCVPVCVYMWARKGRDFFCLTLLHEVERNWSPNSGIWKLFFSVAPRHTYLVRSLVSPTCRI